MEKKKVFVRMSDSEIKKIKAQAIEGETFSATIRRLIFDQHACAKDAVREWNNLMSRLKWVVTERDTVGQKIDAFDTKITAAGKQIAAIAEAQNEDDSREKWVREIEKLLAMLRTIS